MAENAGSGEVVLGRDPGALNEGWLARCSTLAGVLPVLELLAEQAAGHLADHLDAIEAFSPCEGHNWVGGGKGECSECGVFGEGEACGTELNKARCGGSEPHTVALPKSKWKKNSLCEQCGAKLMRIRTCGMEGCPSEFTTRKPPECLEHSHGKQLTLMCDGTMRPCKGCDDTAAILDSLASGKKAMARSKGQLTTAMFSNLNRNWRTSDRTGRGWAAMQVFNTAPGSKPVDTPSVCDISGTLNALLHCQLLRDHLGEVLCTALAGVRELRHEVFHSPQLHCSQKELEQAIKVCEKLALALKAWDMLSTELKAPIADLESELALLRRPPPQHLASVLKEARKPYVATHSLAQICQAFDEWIVADMPVLWITGKRGTGKSFAAAQVYAKHPEALSHFFRNERDGRTAARQLLRQHSGVMTEEMSTEECWEELKQLTEGALIILDGLDEEQPTADSITTVLDSLEEPEWPFSSVRFFITSIHPPPASLNDWVTHVTVTADASVPQLINGYSNALRDNPQWPEAVAKVEEQAAGDLNYVALFFRLHNVGLQAQLNTDSLQHLLKEMLRAGPIREVYSDHVRLATAGRKGAAVDDLLVLLSAFGGISTHCSVMGMLCALGQEDYAAAALEALQTTGLLTVDDSIHSKGTRGSVLVVTLLPGFVHYLRHSDLRSREDDPFCRDYAKEAPEVLEKCRAVLRTDPFLCASTVASLIYGEQAIAELDQLALELAMEPCVTTDSRSLCMVVRALAFLQRMDSAAELWKRYLLCLVTRDNLGNPDSKLHGLCRFGEQLDSEFFSTVAATIRPVLFDLLSHYSFSEECSAALYASKLVRLPCYWAYKHEVGDLCAELTALDKVLTLHPHFASDYTVRTLMVGFNRQEQWDSALRVWNRHMQSTEGEAHFLNILALAYKGKKDLDGLRSLVNRHLSARRFSPVAFLVSLLLETRERDHLEEAMELVERLLSEGTRDMVVLETWARVMKASGIDFPAARDSLEEFCRSVTPPVRPSPRCRYFLLQCGDKLENVDEKAEHVRRFSGDHGKWDEKQLRLFLATLIAAKRHQEAYDIAKEHQCGMEALATAVSTFASALEENLAVSRPDKIAALQRLIDRYEDLRPVYAVGTLVAVLLPPMDDPEPCHLQLAKDIVQRFLQGGTEIRLINCWAEVLCKDIVSFADAKDEVLDLCRSSSPPTQPNSNTIYLLSHCDGLEEDLEEKAKFILEYIGHDEWPDLESKEMGHFLYFLVATKRHQTALDVAARHTEGSSLLDGAVGHASRLISLPRHSDELRQLVETYRDHRPVRAINTLVIGLLPHREMKICADHLAEAKELVLDFLQGGTELLLINSWAHILSKESCSFKEAKSRVLSLCRTADPSVRPDTHTLFSLVHCGGRGGFVRQKAELLLEYMGEGDWAALPTKELRDFLFYFVAAGKEYFGVAREVAGWCIEGANALCQAASLWANSKECQPSRRDIQLLLEAYADLRPLHALLAFVKLSLNSPWGAKTAQVVIERYWEGGQEVELIECWALLLAPPRHDFPVARDKVLELCRTANPPVRPNSFVLFYLCREPQVLNYAREKAELILEYTHLNDWKKLQKATASVFLEVFVGAGMEQQAREAAAHSRHTSLLDKVYSVARAYEEAHDVASMYQLVCTYVDLHPVLVVTKLVHLLLPTAAPTNPHYLAQAKEVVESYWHSYKEQSLLGCWARIMEKEGMDFPAARDQLLELCAAAEAPLRPDKYCHGFLLHCGGRDNWREAKDEYLREYGEGWIDRTLPRDQSDPRSRRAAKRPPWW